MGLVLLFVLCFTFEANSLLSPLSSFDCVLCDNAEWRFRRSSLFDSSYNSICDFSVILDDGRSLRYDGLAFLYSREQEPTFVFPLDYRGELNSGTTTSTTYPIVRFNVCGGDSNLTVGNVVHGEGPTLEIGFFEHVASPWYGLTLKMSADSGKRRVVLNLLPETTRTVDVVQDARLVNNTLYMTLVTPYATPSVGCFNFNPSEPPLIQNYSCNDLGLADAPRIAECRGVTINYGHLYRGCTALVASTAFLFLVLEILLLAAWLVGAFMVCLFGKEHTITFENVFITLWAIICAAFWVLHFAVSLAEPLNVTRGSAYRLALTMCFYMAYGSLMAQYASLPVIWNKARLLRKPSRCASNATIVIVIVMSLLVVLPMIAIPFSEQARRVRLFFSLALVLAVNVVGWLLIAYICSTTKQVGNAGVYKSTENLTRSRTFRKTIVFLVFSSCCLLVLLVFGMLADGVEAIHWESITVPEVPLWISHWLVCFAQALILWYINPLALIATRKKRRAHWCCVGTRRETEESDTTASTDLKPDSTSSVVQQDLALTNMPI